MKRLKKAVEAAVAAHPYIKTTLYMDENGDILQRRNDELPYEAVCKDHLCREMLVRPYKLWRGSCLGLNCMRTVGKESICSWNFTI